MSTEEEYDNKDMNVKLVNLGLWVLGFTLTVLVIYVLYDDTLVKMTPGIFKKVDIMTILKFTIIVYCLTHIPVVRLRYDPNK